MTPLYARVSTTLRDRIRRGELAAGSALPSEAELCQEFGAPGGTVRSAAAGAGQGLRLGEHAEG
ncbi:GntR family transcriptional regulator [Nocardia sp. NPDC004568]|uniref:GntR family transcriptional regulator n=1 Tax=Nocardia sp. NPDC004568 TaxID=3154551 RepID=UPI0033B78FDF